MEIRQADRRERKLMKRLYLRAFPKAERKPFGMICRMAAKGLMETLVIVDRGYMVGLAITARYKDLVLLDYFAVSEAFRGQNYGSRALELLKKRYEGERFILEIEIPEEKASNHQQRVRRKNFYLKGGMKETGIQVLLCGVPMELLTDGSAVSYEEYHDIYKYAVNPVFARKIVRMDGAGREADA